VRLEEEKGPAPHKSAWHGRGRIALRLAGGTALLVVLIWFARDAGDEIKALEAWVSGHGLLGPFVFVAAVVVLSSVFVPSSVLGAVAGALFGLGWGTFAIVTGGMFSAALNYLVANRFLGTRIAHFLQRHPKLLAVQRAVQREELRLQFMLRLAPINSASVNYILGAAGVRFPPYLLATLGMIPGLFVEVYFGHMAKHVTKAAAKVSTQSTAQLLFTIAGFLVCMAVMIGVGRMAQRALAEADVEADVEADAFEKPSNHGL
jgi:uncharacterized membrane protein YdjX (TVP38/TMEM64 family)